MCFPCEVIANFVFCVTTNLTLKGIISCQRSMFKAITCSERIIYKLDGIGVGRIRTVPFSSDSAYDSDAYDPVKTRLSGSQAEAEEPTSHNAGFIQSLASACDSDNLVFTGVISVGVISGIGRKWNGYDSAYDSDF